jgi:hypothetical protein
MAGVAMTAPPRSVSLPDETLIAYPPLLEDAILPSAERIAAAARASIRA